MALIQAHVLPGTTILTDEFGSYRLLNGRGYWNMTVNHDRRQHVAANSASTNQIEGFGRHVKCLIVGAHVSVSGKYGPLRGQVRLLLQSAERRGFDAAGASFDVPAIDRKAPLKASLSPGASRVVLGDRTLLTGSPKSSHS